MELNLEKGILYLIGGKEDRYYEKKVLTKMIELTKASDITLIPTASSYPLEMAREYKDAFLDLGVENINVLDIRYKEDVDTDENKKVIEKTDVVFFTGGDQVRLGEIMFGSKLLDLIKSRHNKGVHIAGSSAGAHIASDPVLYYGERWGLIKGSVESCEGFGFLSDITIDTHFSNRKRIQRLTQFLLSSKSNMGIGLDENTAIAISNDNTFEVVGSGFVTILKKTKDYETNYDELSLKEKISVDGLSLSFLSNGMKYDLNKFKLLKFKKLA